MFTVVPSTREMRPVGVLLGGSGLPRMSTLQPPRVAVLFKPNLSASVQIRWATENHALPDSAGQPC